MELKKQLKIKQWHLSSGLALSVNQRFELPGWATTINVIFAELIARGRFPCHNWLLQQAAWNH